MAATFLQSQSAAISSLDQAERQLGTAVRLVGNLGSAVATRQVPRAETLYGQVNLYLGLATTSNGRAQTEINDMARQSVDNLQKQSTLSLSARSQDIQDGINQTRSQSTALLAQLNNIRYDEQYNEPRPPAVSSGEEVIEEQRANSDDAQVLAPSTPLQTFDDDGNLVDIPTSYSDETNAIEPQLLNTVDLEDNGGVAVVSSGDGDVVTVNQSQNGGPTAPNDDNIQVINTEVSGGGAAEGQRPPIAPEFLSPIVSTPNPLAKLASMTYSISIYLMNDAEYKTLLVSQKKVLPTKQLIIQSGGIDKGSNASGLGQRNPNFNVDFFIDDVSIKSSVGTQGGTRAHNALLLDFSVIEPNGITFLPRLRNAVRQYNAGSSPTISEANTNFLMIVRFYGYDSQGNLVNGSQLGIKEVGSDTNSIVEKWFPFQITNITYKIASKGNVEYRIGATIPQTNIAFGHVTASIPFDFELNAPDIQTLLNGKAVLSPVRNDNAEKADAPTSNNSSGSGAPPKASSLTATKKYTQGLCEALNQWQRDLRDKGDQEIADEYEIIVENVPGLVDAKMARPGRQDKARATMAPAENARDALLERTAQYDKNSKNFNIPRGTQIVQLIDLAVRNSSYITSQQNLVFDEVTGRPKPQTPVSTVQWYRIRSRVVPLGYDNKRRTIAYRTTYTVSRYQINDPRIPLFPQARYRGAHKIYNYWFTGQNSEVLDFDIQVNCNYVTTFGDGQGGPDLAQNLSSGRLYEKIYFQNKPNAEGTGGTGNTTSPAANLSERLYSDADIQKSLLTIIGDPDWLQQSEAFYNLNIDLKPFMPDGSVNYDASEILYEIRFNPVTDYNIQSGLAEVNANNTAYSQATGERNLASQSSVFAAQTVTSYFKQGKFTQRLEGAIRYFDPASADLTAADLAKQSGTSTLNRNANSGQQADIRAVDNAIIAAQGTQTNTLPDPSWQDPSGTTDAGIINDAPNISTPVPKAGSNTVDDDAIPNTPFNVGA